MEYPKHILLDAAKMQSSIYLAKEMNEAHWCLYEGDSEALLGPSAPWLFELDEYSEFADWLSEHGSGNSWGVIVLSQVESEVLYRHFRQFLIVQTEKGKELYFRFYDPRVLRIFLPTCDSVQLREFFGPVRAFVLEDENGNMLQFTLDGSDLNRKDLNIDLEEFLLSGYALDLSNLKIQEEKMKTTEAKKSSKLIFRPR